MGLMNHTTRNTIISMMAGIAKAYGVWQREIGRAGNLPEPGPVMRIEFTHDGGLYIDYLGFGQRYEPELLIKLSEPSELLTLLNKLQKAEGKP